MTNDFYLVGVFRRAGTFCRLDRFYKMIRRRAKAQGAEAQGYGKYQYEQFFHTLSLLSSGPMGHSHCCTMRKTVYTVLFYFILHYSRRLRKKYHPVYPKSKAHSV